jgi:hypothetical protein
MCYIWLGDGSLGGFGARHPIKPLSFFYFIGAQSMRAGAVNFFFGTFSNELVGR